MKRRSLTESTRMQRQGKAGLNAWYDFPHLLGAHRRKRRVKNRIAKKSRQKNRGRK